MPPSGSSLLRSIKDIMNKKTLCIIGMAVVLFFALGASASGDYLSVVLLIFAAFLISPWRGLALDGLPEFLQQKWILISAIVILVLGALIFTAPPSGSSEDVNIEQEEENPSL